MTIDVETLKKKLDTQEDFVFIDVREPNEYQAFNLGARLIPLGNIISMIPELYEYKDAEIVLHCRSGARSALAQRFLLDAGFTNVKNLVGGVLEWQQKFG